MREILSDLVAEQQALDQFLQRVHERDWKTQTPAEGWTISDTVSHLAAVETFAAEVIKNGQEVIDAANITDIDEWTARGVEEGRSKRYQAVIEWWRNGRAEVVDALSRTSATERIPWVISPMSAKTFATVRLMETWAHGLDIKASMEHKLGPLLDEDGEEISDDTARLRHVAWLAHRLLPFSFQRHDEEYPEHGVRIEIMGPRYARWVYGDKEATDVIKGNAGEFCRVAVRRLDPAETELKAVGAAGERALEIIQAY